MTAVRDIALWCCAVGITLRREFRPWVAKAGPWLIAAGTWVFALLAFATLASMIIRFLWYFVSRSI